MKEIELKPCPFCGGRAVVHVKDGVRVICTQCNCMTVALVDGTAQGKATGRAIESVVEKWNQRTN